MQARVGEPARLVESPRSSSRRRGARSCAGPVTLPCTTRSPRALAAGATVVTPEQAARAPPDREHDRAQVAAGQAGVDRGAGAAVDGVGRRPDARRRRGRCVASAGRRCRPRPARGSGARRSTADAATGHRSRRWLRRPSRRGSTCTPTARAAKAGAPGAGGDDEPAAFARWAERYRATLRARRVDDVARGRRAARRRRGVDAAWRGRRFVLAGFLAPTPQQRRVGAALRACRRHRRRPADARRRPRGAASARRSPRRATSSSGALAWARERGRAIAARRASASSSRTSRSACADVRRAADDALGVPGGEAPRAQAVERLARRAARRRPAGRRRARPDRARVDRRCRSAVPPRCCARRTCPDDTRARATLAPRLERPWLERGHATACASATRSPRSHAPRRRARRTPVGDARGLGRAPARDPSRLGRRVARCARRRRLARERAALERRAPGQGGARRAPRRVRRARRRVARASGLAARRARSARSREVSRATPFQPESPPAPIQILGLLEAVGLPFDALWVAGMATTRGRAPPRPHPLLPVRWQRERGVPRATRRASSPMRARGRRRGCCGPRPRSS